jgi:hypothetical protein
LIRDNWAWARKKSDPSLPSAPTVVHLTKTIARRWLLDVLLGKWRHRFFG